MVLKTELSGLCAQFAKFSDLSLAKIEKKNINSMDLNGNHVVLDDDDLSPAFFHAYCEAEPNYKFASERQKYFDHTGLMKYIEGVA